MKVYISGTRNGEAWPAPGGEVDLPDQEGAKLCASGLATPVRDDDGDVEKRSTIDYESRSREELQDEADRRDLAVEGTGKDGYVLKADLVAALAADDA